jgi:phosphoribosylpyrophosphate synthetase
MLVRNNNTNTKMSGFEKARQEKRGPLHEHKSRVLQGVRLCNTIQVLNLFCQGRQHCATLELLTILENTEAAHESPNRPGPITIKENLILDSGLCDPAGRKIILVDDVITTGAHFVACKILLNEQFPETKVIGLFVARMAL